MVRDAGQNQRRQCGTTFHSSRTTTDIHGIVDTKKTKAERKGRAADTMLEEKAATGTANEDVVVAV